ncbi:head-tail joining protein [Rhizobium phage RHph_X2_26]|nr:head-tail joining protein [Rhizobium phage RHph_X2_26]
MGSRKRRTLLIFERRADGSDGYGGTIPGAGAWTEQFRAYAEPRGLRGREEVIGQRLNGVQPFAFTVADSSDVRQVTTAWRIVDAGNPARPFTISAVMDPDGRNKTVEILATQGGPQ